jgi:hypothetical protein
VRVEVTRSGGYAGLVLRGELDTETLIEPERTAVESAIERLAPAPAPTAAPDRFQYRLAIAGADGASREVVFGEPDLPPELAALFSRVLRGGS